MCMENCKNKQVCVRESGVFRSVGFKMADSGLVTQEQDAETGTASAGQNGVRVPTNFFYTVYGADSWSKFPNTPAQQHTRG